MDANLRLTKNSSPIHCRSNCSSLVSIANRSADSVRLTLSVFCGTCWLVKLKKGFWSGPSFKYQTGGAMYFKSGLSHVFLSFAFVAALGGAGPMMSPAALAQVGISTGSIQGTILDPTGATVPGAKVSIASKATGG